MISRRIEVNYIRLYSLNITCEIWRQHLICNTSKKLSRPIAGFHNFFCRSTKSGAGKSGHSFFFRNLFCGLMLNVFDEPLALVFCIFFYSLDKKKSN